MAKRGRRFGQTKEKMAAIKADFIDYIKRCNPSQSLEVMSKEFRVSPQTLSKWCKQAGISRWF